MASIRRPSGLVFFFWAASLLMIASPSTCAEAFGRPTRHASAVSAITEGRRLPPTALPLSSAVAKKISATELASTASRGGDNAEESKLISKKNLITAAVVVPLLYAIAKSSAVSSTLMSFLESYSNSLTTRPIPTKIATGAVLAGVGDALAQSRVKDQPYDKFRTASFSAFDSCYRVFQHFAFPQIVGRCRGNILAGIVAKVGIDASGGLMRYLYAAEQTLAYQFIVVPFIYYPVFFTFTGLVQGLSLADTFARARRDYLKCWSKNLQFWIPMQYYMFGYLGQQWQIPFSCVMGIVWSTILSAFAGAADNNKEKK